MTMLSFSLLVLAWVIAFLWLWRTSVALYHLPRLPNLLTAAEVRSDAPLVRPSVSVIVPACNEEQSIEQTLRSLLAQRNVNLEIIAVNDRSKDATGTIMERVAAHTGIRVIHIRELPRGWMGKTHAMAVVARQATAPWLLFTDGDVIFEETCLHRALVWAENQADHLVLFPTLVLRSFGERMVLSAIQLLSFLTWRPWKIADKKSRESVGIGAFNLVRRDVYDAIGGFDALPMEVLEDLRFGFLIKQHGFRQRFVFGRNLIRVHWASGVMGIVKNLTKNIFAVFRFNPFLLLAVCMALAGFCFVPLLAVAGPGSAPLSSLLVLVCAVAMYRYLGQQITSVRSAYVVLYPIAAVFILYALVRSMLITLIRGGVVWRGTFYPLRELRSQAGPLR